MISSSTTRFTVVASPRHKLGFRSKNILFSALFLSTLLGASVADADSNARELFDAMRAQYANLESYSHTVTVTNEVKKASLGTGKTQFQQPNRYAHTFKDNQTVSNGLTLYEYSPSSVKNSYHALPLPPAKLGRVGLMQYHFAGRFTPFLAGVDPFTSPWGKPPLSWSLGTPITIDKAAVDVVRAKIDDTTEFAYFIGRQDKLLRRINISGGSGKSRYSYTEAFTDIKLNPKFPVGTFAFVAPPNVNQSSVLASYRKLMGIPETINIGRTAPPLVGTDLDGKMVSLEDYRGKVVLLDFWATWCGPCLTEIPHIKAAYEKFRDQGFEVIGISFDQNRKVLENFLQKEQIPWTQLFDGKAWESPVNEHYKVRGIPSTFIIDRNGKISAIHTRSLLLEVEIEKALQKPLNEQ